jgi:hypothetical protein
MSNRNEMSAGTNSLTRSKRKRTLLLVLVTGLVLAFAPAASAHNRAHIILPTGRCIIVGSEKSVTLPDGTFHDLRPGTPWQVADEIGTSFAADEGRSALVKGPCP